MANKYFDLFLRYLILVLIAVPGLSLFYFAFKPLTIYPSFFLLNIFYEAALANSTIIVGNILSSSFVLIEIIDACIAGSAYYLLLILNLSVPNIKIAKRIIMIIGSFIAFLALNLIRIFILSVMAISGSSYFDVTHLLFWYIFSVVFVVGIWFLEIRIFRVKKIPFYSDLKFLFERSNFKKK